MNSKKEIKIMSTLKKFAFVLTIVVVMAIGTQAHAGRETANGGDSVALEFVTIARQVFDDLKGKAGLFPEVDLEQFERAIAETKIVTTDKTFLNEVEKDALNYPDIYMIKVNRSRWSQIGELGQKKSLVFHEYLGVMRVEDSDYRVSGRILSGQEHRNPNLILLEEGNYRLLFGGSNCDIHVETNSSAGKIFLNYISNQRTGEQCKEIKQAISFQCGADGVCRSFSHDDNSSPPLQIQIINGRNFLDQNNLKYTFVNNGPIAPAKKFTSDGWYGFKNVDARSYTSQSRCVILAEEGNIWCDDWGYADRVFCPKARLIAMDTVLRDCQNETGRVCEVTDIGIQKIHNRQSDGEYDSRSGSYFYKTDLYCEVTNMVAVPVGRP